MLYLYGTVIEMTNKSYFKKGTISFRAIAIAVAICLLLGGIFWGPRKANKQEAIAYSLPSPTKILPLSRWQSYPVLKGIRIDPENPLNLEFIIDTADKDDVTKEEASRLIRYFLAGLTLPDEELWVNLSPYEEERVVSDALALTDLGKDMLGQDYVLKQLLSSLTYPEDKLGKEYWKKVYQEVARIAGTTNIPINTFNKVWIMPDKAKVYEKGNVAFIARADLKCMLEEDYIAMKNSSQTLAIDETPKNKEEISKVASKIMKQIVLPKIQEDVSYGKNFATLRQICHSLILAVWFKQKFKDSFYKHYIDQGKIKGIDLEDKGAKDKIYNLYVEAYKKGVYDYVRSDYDTASREYIDRRYYSGGMKMAWAPKVEVAKLPPGASSTAGLSDGDIKTIAVTVQPRIKDKRRYANARVAGSDEQAFDPSPEEIRRITESSEHDVNAVDTLRDMAFDLANIAMNLNVANENEGIYLEVILTALDMLARRDPQGPERGVSALRRITAISNPISTAKESGSDAIRFCAARQMILFYRELIENSEDIALGQGPDTDVGRLRQLAASLKTELINMQTLARSIIKDERTPLSDKVEALDFLVIGAKGVDESFDDVITLVAAEIEVLAREMNHDRPREITIVFGALSRLAFSSHYLTAISMLSSLQWGTVVDIEVRTLAGDILLVVYERASLMAAESRRRNRLDADRFQRIANEALRAVIGRVPGARHNPDAYFLALGTLLSLSHLDVEDRNRALAMMNRYNKTSAQDLSYLILDKFSGDEELLQEVMEDSRLDSAIRLYAWGLMVARHETDVGIDAFTRYNADTLLENIESLSIGDLLASPLARNNLRVYSLAALLYIDEELVTGICGGEVVSIIMGADIARGGDSATSQFDFGSVLIQEGDGRDLALLIAHELGHFLPVNSEQLETSLSQEAAEEIVSDMLYRALAEQLKWPTSNVDNILNNIEHYTNVRSRIWNAIGPHEAARSQQVVLRNSLPDSISAPWTKLLRCSLAVGDSHTLVGGDFFNFVREILQELSFYEFMPFEEAVIVRPQPDSSIEVEQQIAIVPETEIKKILGLTDADEGTIENGRASSTVAEGQDVPEKLDVFFEQIEQPIVVGDDSSVPGEMVRRLSAKVTLPSGKDQDKEVVLIGTVHDEEASDWHFEDGGIAWNENTVWPTQAEKDFIMRTLSAHPEINDVFVEQGSRVARGRINSWLINLAQEDGQLGQDTKLALSQASLGSDIGELAWVSDTESAAGRNIHNIDIQGNFNALRFVFENRNLEDAMYFAFAAMKEYGSISSWYTPPHSHLNNLVPRLVDRWCSELGIDVSYAQIEEFYNSYFAENLSLSEVTERIGGIEIRDRHMAKSVLDAQGNIIVVAHTAHILAILRGLASHITSFQINEVELARGQLNTQKTIELWKNEGIQNAGSSSSVNDLGGIDFNTDQFNIQTQGQGLTLPANTSFNANLEGLTFTVITIEDLTDFELSQLTR